jgi:hypothetical protein
MNNACGSQMLFKLLNLLANQPPSAINASAMSYALRFYIYLFVADVVAVVIAV